MNELEIYQSMAIPPESATKKITGGRLSGMTDIKPQWRILVLTETFGLCGFGWRYTVDKQWTEPGANGEIFAFVNISLYVKREDKWSKAIPGTGGSMLVAKEKSGLYCSDEAFKMATTDAISVAAKFIGVGADIYMGHGSGKYTKPPETKPEITREKITEEFPGSVEMLIEGQEVPKEFWGVPKSERYNYIPKGCSITKIENKFIVLRNQK